MVDWLKAIPSMTMNDFLWKLSVPMAKIMAADATQVAYLSEKQAKKAKQRRNSITFDDMLDDELMTDTGVPIFDN